jgi:hypothetical protein
MKTPFQILENLTNTPSDINEHILVLKKYAEECESITEFGVRWVVSTFAFIFAHPEKLTSIDLFHPSHFGTSANNRIDFIENYAKNYGINFKFVIGDSSSVEIEETDLLFIDTLHRYGQLKIELEKHASKCKKYIILHDTTLFAFEDEGIDYIKTNLDNSKMGLWPAVEEFLQKNQNWYIVEKRSNNNGLTVLGRRFNI